MARTRMAILFDQSALENALVIGTSNKTEILLGYGTLFGDMACAFNPIGDIYKKMFGNCHDIWEFLKKLLTSSRVQIYGKGKQTRKNWD